MTTSRVDLWLQPGWESRHCRDSNPEDFYQKDGEHWSAARKRLLVAANFFCRGCPIRQACQEAGPRSGGWGLWGGVTYRRDGHGRLISADLLDPRQRAG